MLNCPYSAISLTLDHLQAAGRQGLECVVLWLGHRAGETTHVARVYRPSQQARADMFYIPPPSMTALQAELRQGRLMVAAQVHSHPGEAFHSEADDKWAIIRHEGALSLVLPDFALRCTPARFMLDAKVYRFTEFAHWKSIPEREVPSWLQIR